MKISFASQPEDPEDQLQKQRVSQCHGPGLVEGWYDGVLPTVVENFVCSY